MVLQSVCWHMNWSSESILWTSTNIPVQKKAFSFKCHREKNATTQSDIIYAVNAIAFHPRFGTFATGGGDSCVFLWDGESKNRLRSVRGYPTSVSSLAFSASGTKLAIAASYAFEKVGQ